MKAENLAVQILAALDVFYGKEFVEKLEERIKASMGTTIKEVIRGGLDPDLLMISTFDWCAEGEEDRAFWCKANEEWVHDYFTYILPTIRRYGMLED